MHLWNVTFTYPQGRRFAHHSYGVLAATAEEAKAKAVAYVHPVPAEPVNYTIEAEEDSDGVLSLGSYVTRKRFQ